MRLRQTGRLEELLIVYLRNTVICMGPSKAGCRFCSQAIRTFLCPMRDIQLHLRATEGDVLTLFIALCLFGTESSLTEDLGQMVVRMEQRAVAVQLCRSVH